MKRPSTTTAIVFVATLINGCLVGFFMWLAFSPPVIFRESPNGLPFMIAAAYPLANVISLAFFGKRNGIGKAIWCVVFGLNLLLILGVVVFGFGLAWFQLPFTLLFSIPPVLTAVGFYAQLRMGARMTS